MSFMLHYPYLVMLMLPYNSSTLTAIIMPHLQEFEKRDEEIETGMKILTLGERVPFNF